MKSEISSTWILFASGNSVKIELSLYDPAADRNRPITAYMVSDVGSDIARSASRAAETVFAVAHDRKVAPPPTVAGFDLQGLKSGSQIAGASSGLALALALAKKLWPTSGLGPCAATGEIISSGNGGLLHKISQIEAKTQTVFKLLSDGGLFFYPADNDREISIELKEKLKEHGIKACPVTSVADALATSCPEIFPKIEPETAPLKADPAPKKNSAPNFAFLAAATILILMTLAGWLYSNGKTPLLLTKPSADIIKAPTITPPKKNLTTTSDTNQQKQPLPKPLTVSLTGASNPAKFLAQRTSSRLKASLDSDKELFVHLKSVNGEIKIGAIKERRDPKSDALKSTINVSFMGQATLLDLSKHRVMIEPLSISGPGPMQQQLTTAATLLVEHISKVLQNLSPVKPTSVKVATPLNDINNNPESNVRSKISPDQGFE